MKKHYFVTVRESFRTNPSTSEEIEFRDTANDVLDEVTYGYVENGKYYRQDNYKNAWINDLFNDAIADPNQVKRILFFTHGLTNDLYQGIEQGMTYDSLLNNVIVVTLHWPSAGYRGPNLAVHDASRRSGAPLAAFLNKIANKHRDLLAERYMYLDKPDVPRISCLNHSMGNMTFGHIMNALPDYLYFPEMIFLASAYSPNDAPQNHNTNTNGLRLCAYMAAKGVIIYHADDDMTLRYASVLPESGGYQLGQTGMRDPSLSLNNVYQFDISDFNNYYDPSYGHDCYWTARNDKQDISPALQHIQRSLDQNQIADLEDKRHIKQHYLFR